MEYRLEQTLPLAEIINDLAFSPDGALLVAQVRHDTGATPSEWSLRVVSLPAGEAVATIPLGSVSAGLLRVAPGAERIACTRVDGTREVRVFRRAAGVSE